MIAVGENAVEASYIVLVCIVGFGDLGILLMIFVPKVLFSRKGLPEGVSVGQSIFKKHVSRELQQTSSQDKISKKSGVRSSEQGPESTLEQIIKEGVEAEPPTGTEVDPEESKKHEEGALVNCLTLQW